MIKEAPSNRSSKVNRALENQELGSFFVALNYFARQPKAKVKAINKTADSIILFNRQVRLVCQVYTAGASYLFLSSTPNDSKPLLFLVNFSMLTKKKMITIGIKAHRQGTLIINTWQMIQIHTIECIS